MASRQERRAAAKKEKKLAGRPKVYLAIPEAFLDISGEPWSLGDGKGGIVPFDLAELLLYTVRQTPVRTGGDAFRALDVYNAINDAPDGYLEMARDDWDWMLAHFKEMAHTVWKAPDAAYLVRWLEANVKTTQPVSKKGEE